MNKAVIYTRVSTEEQAKESHYSLDAQKRECKEFASKLQYKVIKTFIDAGKSAKDTKGRPAFMDMLEFAKDINNQITAVVVLHTDRFARNVGDHNIVKADLKKHGVELLSVAQPSLGNTPEANMMDNVSASFNQYWSDVIAYKTKLGMEEKARTGWKPNMAPLGYLNSKNGSGKNIIIQDKKRTPFIRRAFELYVSGEYGGERINDLLYKEGFRSRRGHKLSLSKLYVILENPFYYGDFIWDGKLWTGKHTPIVLKELWALAQKIRKARTGKKIYERKWKFLLSSYVFCKCGQRLTAEHHFKHSKGNQSKKTFSYYHCPGGKKCKSSRYIPTEELEKQVKKIFIKVQFNEAFYTSLIVKLEEKHDHHRHLVSSQVKSLERTKMEVTKKRDKAEKMLLDGIITKEVYQRNSIKYEKEIKQTDEALSDFKHKQNLQLGEFKEVIAFSQDIYKIYEKGSFEAKKLCLGFFWDKFIVKGKKITKAEPTPLFAILQKLQTEVNQQKATGFAIKEKTPIKKSSSTSYNQSFINFDTLGGKWDLNPRPPGPQPGALTS